MLKKGKKMPQPNGRQHLIFWPQAKDIYGVHNSYSFMMGQRCMIF